MPEAMSKKAFADAADEQEEIAEKFLFVVIFMIKRLTNQRF